jgi:hypothetical protein
VNKTLIDVNDKVFADNGSSSSSNDIKAYTGYNPKAHAEHY